MQGKFWKMHDVLIEHRLELGTVEFSNFAEEARLDVLRFLQDLYSKEALRRVKDDIKLADSLGVDATPAGVARTCPSRTPALRGHLH